MPRPIRVDFPDFDQAAVQSGQMFAQLPRILGNMAKNYFDDSWRRQGWQDKQRVKWQSRSRKDANPKRRAILVKSGRLRRSLSMRVIGQSVLIFTDVPYAQIHNEGGQVTGTAAVKSHTRRLANGKKVTVRAHKRSVNFTMPQRQFMSKPGDALPSVLERRMQLHVERAIERIMP